VSEGEHKLQGSNGIGGQDQDKWDKVMVLRSSSRLKGNDVFRVWKDVKMTNERLTWRLLPQKLFEGMRNEREALRESHK